MSLSQMVNMKIWRTAKTGKTETASLARINTWLLNEMGMFFLIPLSNDPAVVRGLDQH